MTISFARGIPAPECLPVEELADCAQAALRRDGETILSYGSTLGYAPLREWIAERHGVDPGRVVVTNGSLQVFHFLISALKAGPVIVERPTYDRPRKILREEGRELIVLVGEIGGDEEEKAAAFIETEVTKPVIAYIAGFTAPPGKTMGHAGAIISGSSGTAAAKKEALEARGVRVGTNPTEVAQLVAAGVRS